VVAGDIKLGHSSILLDGNSVTQVFSSAKLRYNYKMVLAST